MAVERVHFFGPLMLADAVGFAAGATGAGGGGGFWPTLPSDRIANAARHQW